MSFIETKTKWMSARQEFWNHFGGQEQYLTLKNSGTGDGPKHLGILIAIPFADVKPTVDQTKYESIWGLQCTIRFMIRFL
jgi:hypothetical protein